MQRHVLIIEDEQSQRRLMQELMERKLGLLVTAVATGKEALQLAGLSDCRYAAILVDMHLRDMHGLDVVRQLRHRYPAIPIIMMSGNNDMQSAVQAMRAGANDFLTKPIASDRLMLSLNDVFMPTQQKVSDNFAEIRSHGLSLLGSNGEVRRMHDLESAIIAFALEHYNCHMSEVARRLGIGRSTLYRKVQDYGLNAPRMKDSA